jgi:hypothetical protein
MHNISRRTPHRQLQKLYVAAHVCAKLLNTSLSRVYTAIVFSYLSHNLAGQRSANCDSRQLRVRISVAEQTDVRLGSKTIGVSLQPERSKVLTIRHHGSCVYFVMSKRHLRP